MPRAVLVLSPSSAWGLPLSVLPSQVQLIHFNQELYGNLSAASRGPNGLAILSLFVNVSPGKILREGGAEAWNLGSEEREAGRPRLLGPVGGRVWGLGLLGSYLLSLYPLHRWLAAQTHSSAVSLTGTPSPASPTRVSPHCVGGGTHVRSRGAALFTLA